MKPIAAIAAALALAVGFGVGRATAPRREPEPFTLASLQQALEDPDWLLRTYRFSGFAQQLTPENLSDALAILEPKLPWLVTDELRLLMFAWSRFDAPGALQHALAWPPLYRRSGAGAAIYAWAFRDPEAALLALESVEDAELKAFLEKRLIAGWAHGEHRQSASVYLASLPEGPRRFEHIGTLAWELSKQGPDAVTGWAEQVPAVLPRYKAAAFLKAGTTLAALDPPGAARWLSGHVEHAYAHDALRAVARSWVVRDPVAAMDWLTQLPAGEARDTSVSAAFGVWLNRSSADAEQWLRSATPARALDPAVRMLIGRTRQAAPAAAQQWLAAIDDPALRERVRGALAEPGSQLDQGAALEPDVEASAISTP
jgi:hypothetical protein